MGAEQFRNRVSAKTADEGFKVLVEEAQYNHGHSGYSGTIAEKRSFQMVTPEPGESAKECVSRIQDDDSHFSDDKWGPAACIDDGPCDKIPGNRKFIFWGWASS